MGDRGASEDEVRKAIEEGSSEPARKGRIMFRKNLPFNAMWGESTILLNRLHR